MRILSFVLFVLCLNFLPHFTQGAEKYKAGDRLFVAPTKGLNLRKSPDFQSAVLATLDYNTQVTIAEDSLPSKPFQVAVTNFAGGKLSLQGHWVKVRSGHAVGYVFDGMLSNYKGLTLGSYDEDAWLVSLFGKPTLKTSKKSMMAPFGKIDFEIEEKTYPRALVFESTWGDGCGSYEYTFSISFNETYWLIERMMVRADAADDTKIKKLKGKTVFSFDSCT
ncbi:SH3 domain-containing protein [Rufibacter hautae]|uniref:SH3 domain-containing protein n=1 Tax=Rufibacter hautae TaxID=2595005 RepID=A0A5B6TK14_9BACT|nr:SH3 domain-containing protein [Rufibacter hautae]KAA3436522.1 SH3 domain-containing protein [Rufibacter hautae]